MPFSCPFSNKKEPVRWDRLFLFLVTTQTYLEAFAALIASIIIGTTLNRSPQMP